MRFTHKDLTGNLEWTETRHLNELVIESPVFLRKLLRSLVALDGESEVNFIRDGEAMNFAKDIEVIYNPLHLDFNNKRALTTLLKMLVKSSLSEEHYMKTNELKSRIVRYLNEIVDSEHFAFEVATGDFAFDDIAKAVSLHVVDDEDDFVELLTGYMTMMAELAGIKMFVFLNLRSVLSYNETIALMKNLDNHQLDVLLVESQRLPVLPGAHRITIDRDLCEL